MHADDRKWVADQLNQLKQHDENVPLPLFKQQVLQQYQQAYKEAHDAEPLAHRKDGKARSHANSRLLKFVKTIKELQQ